MTSPAAAGRGATDEVAVDAPTRRLLLKGALGSGLAITTLAAPAAGQQPAAAPTPDGKGELAAPEDDYETLVVPNPNSDRMVDVIKSIGIEYIAANPGSSFRGLHESIINYGGNAAPELLTCLHEETSVAIAAGYARVTGRPMGVMMHATVGLQHGSMSIYHAFADRVPVLMFGGASLNAATRRPYIEWIHSAQDDAALVREFTKWDDQPISIQHFAESTVRAARLASSVPMGPTLVMIDTDLQEEAFDSPTFTIPKFTVPMPPVGDRTGVERIAEALVGAASPLIVAHRYARTPTAMGRLVELAELLQIPVADSFDRFNFPTDHPLNHSQSARSLAAEADVILALEPVDLWGMLNKLRDQNHRPVRRTAKPDVALFTIGTSDTGTKSNYQSFQRFVAATLALDGDAEATMPLLIEAVRRRITPAIQHATAERGETLKSGFEATRERNRQEARFGWGASPVSTARLCSELWELIRDEDWVLASQTNSVSAWPQRLWDFNKPGQYVGAIGAGGIGSSIGTATGAALAHRGAKRIVVNIQSDGDLLYAPGALWTQAHHAIPILNVVHNNRAYHQETMHIQRMAGRRERGIDRAHIGTEIADPPVNFAKLAASMGVWSAGPISRPGDLRAALARGLAVVKTGRPALVEVITQPR